MDSGSRVTKRGNIDLHQFYNLTEYPDTCTAFDRAGSHIGAPHVPAGSHIGAPHVPAGSHIGASQAPAGLQQLTCVPGGWKQRSTADIFEGQDTDLAMASLEPLLKEIEKQVDRGRSWQLPVDRIPDLLEMDHATFYQQVYSAANSGAGTVDYSTLTRTFDQESVGELVDLVELFAGTRAEEALSDLGIFIPHPLRVELTSLLFETATKEARAHSVDEATFRAMLTTLGNYESARDTYFNEYFSRDALIETASKRFVRDRSFRAPELARESAVEVLIRMFRSHIVELETLLVSVGLELFNIAVEAGYARSYEEAAAEWQRAHEDRSGERERDDSGTNRSGGEMEERVSWACRVLELRRENMGVSTIKRAYKRLMLRYHPDVNPRGLQKAKQINRAYSILLEAV